MIDKQDFGGDLFRLELETNSIQGLQNEIQAIGIFAPGLGSEIELVIEETAKTGLVVDGRIDLVGDGIDQGRHRMALKDKLATLVLLQTCGFVSLGGLELWPVLSHDEGVVGAVASLVVKPLVR